MTDQTWQGILVDRLITLRAEGYTFATAWSAAIHEAPIRNDCSGRLFDETGQPSETVVMFFRRACESAWHGERGPAGSGQGPALGHFRAEMVRPLDGSGPAKMARVSRAFRSAA